jgi:hypothetical protein
VTACKNCGEELPRAARFCFACGQSTRVLTRPWREVVRDLLDELFDLDGRMLTSLRLLFTRPGQLSHEYNQGRRMSYTPPLRLYLLISLVFFFVLPMILPESQNTNTEHRLSVDLYSRGMFLSLPIYALLLKLFYRKFYYLEHLVFTTYLFSFMFVVFAAMMAIETKADRYLAVMLIQVALLVYMAVYFVMSLRRCYGESWLKTSLKALALVIIFLTLLGVTIEMASHSGT